MASIRDLTDLTKHSAIRQARCVAFLVSPNWVGCSSPPIGSILSDEMLPLWPQSPPTRQCDLSRPRIEEAVSFCKAAFQTQTAANRVPTPQQPSPAQNIPWASLISAACVSALAVAGASFQEVQYGQSLITGQGSSLEVPTFVQFISVPEQPYHAICHLLFCGNYLKYSRMVGFLCFPFVNRR